MVREVGARGALVCSTRASFLTGSAAPKAFEIPALVVCEPDPLRSFLEEAGQLVAPQQGPPPFAFARPSVQQESISVREPEVSSLSMSLIPIPSAQRVALLARKRLVFFREQRLPLSALKRPDNQISHHWQSLNELNV